MTERKSRCATQAYEKLGIDPELESTMTYAETHDFLRDYCTINGLDAKTAEELNDQVYRPWTLDDLPMMEAWLEKNGPVLDLVREAVRRPAFCLPPVRGKNKEALVETYHLGAIMRIRSFARMLQARANYRVGTGDIDGAIDDVISCELLGRYMESQATVVERLVGIAVEGIAISVGIAAIRDSQPTEAQLQRFVDELNALPPRPGMDRMWLAERYLTLDLLQALALGDAPLSAILPPGEYVEKIAPGIAAYGPIDWNVVMRRVNEQYDNMDDRYDRYVMRPPALPSLGHFFIGVRSRRVGDLITGLSVPAFQATLEASRRSKCLDNLQRINLAMLLYERTQGTLPPAYSVDAAGRPLHSWRVLLLPYLGEKELFDKLRLNEPWDSQHNRQFHGVAIAAYQCPTAALEPGQTTYFVVTGKTAAFQAGEGKSLSDFGMNLVLVVEREQSSKHGNRGQSFCWMDPASELARSIASEGINHREDEVNGIGSPHPGGANIGFRDGSVRFIPSTIELPSLKSLLEGAAEDNRY